MSRSDTLTKLPLDTWARMMRINPLHFAGVNITQMSGSTISSGAWVQYSWQDNSRVSREEVADAIRSAEDDIEEALRFRLLPTWDADEWKATARPGRKDMVNLNDRDVRGRWQHVKPKWGWFISGGIRAKEVISAGEAVAWSSTRPPDAYKDTGTVTVGTTITDPQEIRLYYPGKAGDDAWEIRPINVAIASGVATITFNRELLVAESILESQDIGSLSNLFADGAVDAQFESTVDVYRVYNDPQQQAHLLWEPVTVLTDEEAGSYTTQTAVLALHGDARNPAVTYRPATWDATTLQFNYSAYSSPGYQPDIVRLWYQSGFRDKGLAQPDITMAHNLAQAVAICAAARLSKGECGGVDLDDLQRDLTAEAPSGIRQRGVVEPLVNNPLGTKKGEVDAWRIVRELALGQSVSA